MNGPGKEWQRWEKEALPSRRLGLVWSGLGFGGKRKSRERKGREGWCVCVALALFFPELY